MTAKDVPAVLGINEKPTRFMDISTTCAICGHAPDFLEIVKHASPWTYQLSAKCHSKFQSLVWDMSKHDPAKPVIFFSK